MEEVIAFGMNPKGGKGLKAMFTDLKQHGIKDMIGVGGGVLVSDLVPHMLSEPKKGKESMFVRGSTTDLIVTGVASIVSGFIGRMAGGDRMGVAAMHGGMAVLAMKALASGKQKPLGDSIQAGYGSRLRNMFAGPKDELLFISGMGDDEELSGTYTEEGALQGGGLPAVVTQ